MTTWLLRPSSSRASAFCASVVAFSSRGGAFGDEAEQERVDEDREDRAGQHQIAALGRENLEIGAERDQDEGEFADLGEADRDRHRGLAGMAEGADDCVGDDRLADDDDRDGGEQRPRLLGQHRGVEQHPDRDEEQDRKGIAQRQRLFGRPPAELGFAQDHAREEGAQCERHVESEGRAEGDTERERQHRQPEEFARAGPHHPVEQPGDQPPSDHQHQGDEARDLEDDAGERLEDGATLPRGAGERGDHHQGEHHRQILDDQPADRDPPPFGIDQIAGLQRAQQHHGARHRQRQAEDQARLGRPAHRPGERHAHAGRRGDLHDRARHRDRLHREQVAEREMQADAEHQQDHADLGQFGRHPRIGDEAGGERPDDDPGEEIAGDRRDFEPVRQRAHSEGDDETGDDGADQGRMMRHVLLLSGPALPVPRHAPQTCGNYGVLKRFLTLIR